jgi:peptidyl-prolyl cis-trans isomerase D
MMKQMRENTKVILWIVVVAFVVTIFAVWGLDLRGSGGAPGASQYNTLGKVNGMPISRSQYQSVYEQLSAQMREAQPEGRLSYSQQELIHDQTWENLVTSILTSQEIEKLGIVVTDEEVVSFLMTSPPPEIQRYFVDENGNFDYAAYQAALQNPEADWTSVEALARERIPMIKLNTYLVAQVHVSPDEVRAVFEEENTSITAVYVNFPLAAEDISGYTPTEEEIQAYYDDNADDFRRGERATVEYVKIPIEPTSFDLDGLMYTANTLSDQVVAGEDFAEMARVYSQAPTSSVGGETGFITASHRDAEVMTRVAIMNDGQVSEPIQTKDGVYLVKLLEKKEEDGETTYNIQEIFLELAAGRETLDSLIALARGVRELAVEKDLAKAAADSGLAVEKSDPFQRNFPIPGMGFVPSVSRFAFNNEPDVISNVIGDEINYYVVRVAERLPASVQPLEDVRTIIEERLKYERQKSMALRKAQGFHLKMRTSPTSFQEAAEDYGIEVHTPEAFRYIDPLEGMSPRSPFAYAALHSETGALSPPVESGGAYVVFKVLDRAPFDEEEYVSRASAIAERLRAEKVRAYIGFWYEQLKENAEIEDYRGNA